MMSTLQYQILHTPCTGTTASRRNGKGSSQKNINEARNYPSILEKLSQNYREQKTRHKHNATIKYKGADKSLARPTSRRILFDG